MARSKSNRRGRKRPGKKTKSAKSRLKKEQERALHEEEERRLRVEAEEKARRAARAKREYEIEVIEKIALLRPKQQLQSEREFEAIKGGLKSSKDVIFKDPDWERYTRCDGKPDPSSLPEINTFITTKTESTYDNVEVVLEESKVILELITELRIIMKDPYQAITKEEEKTHLHTIDKLENLLMFRYDKATLKILKQAVLEADPDTGNLQKIVEGENEAIFLWGNLNKNPRFKGFNFKCEGVQFEIPKSMTMIEFAFRLLKTRFDPFSHRCKSFLPKTSMDVESKVTMVASSNMVLRDAIASSVGELALSASSKDALSPTSIDSPQQRLANSSITMKSLLSVAKEESKEESALFKSSKDLPEESIIQVKDVTPTSSDIKINIEDSSNAFNLRQYTRLGDVYHIDLLELPPQKMLLNGWTWQQILDKSLTKVQLPLPEIASRRIGIRLSALSVFPGEERFERGKNEVARSTLGITFKLPSNITFFAQPEIGIWDTKKMHWTSEGITDMVFQKEKFLLSFNMKQPGIVAIFQKTYLNMPFLTWELRPTGVDSCCLNVTGNLMEVELEFKEAQCRLVTPYEGSYRELSHIYDKWMSVDELILLMEKSGVTFFPREDATSVLQIPTKAAPFCVSGSDHDLDSVPDEDWDHYLVSEDRSYKLKLPYYSDEFDEAICDNCEHQCDLLHVMRLTKIPYDEGDGVLDSIRERSQSVDPFYVDAVHKMLKAVDPILISK